MNFPATRFETAATNGRYGVMLRQFGALITFSGWFTYTVTLRSTNRPFSASGGRGGVWLALFSPHAHTIVFASLL